MKPSVVLYPTRLALLLGALALSGCAALAPEPEGCASDVAVAELARRFSAAEPAINPPAGLSMAAAECSRDKLVRALSTSQGRIVGYKAGLTNPAVQKRFNASAPVRGNLFERGLLADGATVAAGFGARPLYEADLVVEVGSSAIHDARTPAEVLAQLRNVRPFIELPDLVVQDPGKLDGAGVTAINVGARLGVLGSPLSANDPRLLDALRDMTVRVRDAQGTELAQGKGAAILEHPLNAVIWLAADLKRAGITLQAGDLLSLGSFTPLTPPRAGQSIRVVYGGLPGNPSVGVNFR